MWSLRSAAAARKREASLPRLETDENTEVSLSERDLFAQGSDIETYDMPADDLDEAAPTVDESGEGGRRKFLDSDTVITDGTEERKR